VSSPISLHAQPQSILPTPHPQCDPQRTNWATQSGLTLAKTRIRRSSPRQSTKLWTRPRPMRIKHGLPKSEIATPTPRRRQHQLILQRSPSLAPSFAGVSEPRRSTGNSIHRHHRNEKQVALPRLPEEQRWGSVPSKKDRNRCRCRQGELAQSRCRIKKRLFYVRLVLVPRETW
jgi:hypothetical protein